MIQQALPSPVTPPSQIFTMACQFGSPDLVTSLSGTVAAPTFAFDAANSNYLGLVGSFTSSRIEIHEDNLSTG
jgi:hypothetical protein